MPPLNPTARSAHLPIAKPIPKLFKFQEDAYEWLRYSIQEEKLPSEMLIGSAGFGKTYILAQLIKILKESSFFKDKPISAFPVLYVTKAPVVIQTERVMREFGLSTAATDIFITNYDQLRSKLGEIFIEEYTEIFRGEPVIKFRWKSVGVLPMLIIWDECHSLMNEQSIQSQIAQALNDLPMEYLQHVVQVFTSATPFGRPSEGKCFSVATRIPYRYGYVTSPLTNDHWLDFISHVVGPNIDYRDHSPLGCKRLRETLSKYIYTIKGVKPKFHARNSTLVIQFRTRQERQLYDIAFEEYQQALREAGRNELEGLAKIWVAILKFTQAAELIRAPYLAEAMVSSVKNGKAAVLAFRFKATGVKVIELLVNEHGVSRDAISVIWGGIADEASLKDNYQGLDLGTQNLKQRQVEIDKFQSGKSLYCLFTFSAGGTGLSLHHDKPSLRPREVYVTPCYNAKQLVQGLGRCARITSLSDTVQTIVYFADTIEEEVAAKVEIKLRCLKEVVNQKEDWTYDVFNKGYKRVEEPRKQLEDSDEDDTLDGGFIEDDSEEGEVIDI